MSVLPADSKFLKERDPSTFMYIVCIAKHMTFLDPILNQ